MRRFPFCALGMAALVGAPAHALNLESSYESQRERDTHVPAHGYSLTLSEDFSDQYFASVSYSHLRTDPFDDSGTKGREQYTALGADGGVELALNDLTDASLTLGFTQSNTRGLDGFANDPRTSSRGPSGSVMLSFHPHPWTELFIGPAYSYVGAEPAWQGNVGLSLKLLRSLWFTASYWSGAAKDGWSAGLRFGGN